MERDEIDLTKLTDFQKRRLIKFYDVKSIDDLEVLDDGTIRVKKKTGGTKSKPIKVYLEDRDGKHEPLSIDEFVKDEKDREILEGFIGDVLKDIKKTNEIHTLSFEHIGKSLPHLLIFQSFVLNYADKLKRMLCGGEINKKYIKATGSPGYSDVDFYNIIKKSDNELIIKGFAFCGYPNRRELFVNLVCGTGGTAKLIQSMMDAVEAKRLQYKPKYIALESIETEQALQFYGKLGFRKPKKDAIATITDMIDSKAKTFKQYADEKQSKAGGKLYLFPHNAEGEKHLKKLNCEWIYTPDKWFDTIITLKKEKKPKKYIKEHMIETMRTSKLEGDGIGDFFKGLYNKGKELVSNVVNRFKPKLDDFTNQTKATLGKYGDWKVADLYIQRAPIMGILDKVINVLSFGKFQELKNKYGYDKLFHLQLGIVVVKDGQRKKLTAEKNETVDITEESSSGVKEGTQAVRVPQRLGKTWTLNQPVDDTRKRVGDYSFFSYDAFNNNCQFFIRYLLETMNLYGEREKSFLFQDMAEFQKELPTVTKWIARKVTDIGATVANIRGKGKPDGLELHAVIFNKEQFDLETAKEKAKDFIEGKKSFFRETGQSYRFRNIPKQRFKKESFVTKKLEPGLSLVFGQEK